MRARYFSQHAETETFGKNFQQWNWLGVQALSDYARHALTQNPQFETDGDENPIADPDPWSAKPSLGA